MPRGVRRTEEEKDAQELLSSFAAEENEEDLA
jgi:hypothetical protein